MRKFSFKIIVKINKENLNFSSRAIGTINFEKRFLNFIADTMN